MGPQPSPCDIEAVKQRGECRTEEPVAQEICGKVHQYGGIDVLKPDCEKEMHRIVGRKEQQRRTHDPSGPQVILKYGLLRSPGGQEINAEEQHQRQRDGKRLTIHRTVHFADGLNQNQV